MSEEKSQSRKDRRPVLSTGQTLLNITLFCVADNSTHHLQVPSGMKVSTLLELALERLSQGDSKELGETLKRFYEPVLELQKKDGGYELPPYASLTEAGISDGDVVRIAARPLNLTLFSSSDNTRHHFCVPPEMKVSVFLELALAKLSEGRGAQRVEALKRCYQPVLELQDQSGGRELPTQASLAEEKITDGAAFRIAARPLKEHIMFCRYG